MVDNTPSTVGQVMELISSLEMDPAQSTPSEWLSVRANELAGPFPWYKTIDGTPDSTEEFPGRFVIIGTGSDTFTIEFRALVEFKDGVAPANTPQELDLVRQKLALRKAALIEEHRKSLLGVLKNPVPAAAPTPVARILVCGVCGEKAGGPHRTDCPLRTSP